MSASSTSTARKPIDGEVVDAPAADRATAGAASRAPVDFPRARDRLPVPALPANPHYDMIGGATAVRALVDRFYVHMDALPEARGIRALHPADLAPVKDKLYRFLSGWLGGPPLYGNPLEKPRLRHSHLPFPIGDAERDAWMTCMTRALDDVVKEASLRTRLRQAFFKTATFLRNR
jgi:hemoglobin